MLFRTACVPRLRAVWPLYSHQTPQWQRNVLPIARSSTKAATQEAVKLPKLPVPPLSQTMNRYLRTLEPVLTPGELAQSKQAAQTFFDKDAPPLQEMLEERAACLPNWLEDLWLEAAYLGYRDSVVVNSSPSLMMPMQNFRNESERLIYASKVIFGALQFSRRIFKNEIEQQFAGGAPQDMTQFYRIVGTNRIPCAPVDKVMYADPSNVPRHIVVVRNNNFFKLPVLDSRLNPIPEEAILFMLRHVVDNSCETGPGIGILTAMDRDSWAAAYKLLRSPTLGDNVKSLQEIESGLFVMCLDNAITEPQLDRRTDISLQLLHGRGSSYNSANRWFDKCIQFIVGAGGEVGLCYEHTPAEAIPVSEMVDHILKYIATSETKLSTEVECPRPIPLPFEVDEPIKSEIQKACKQMNATISNLDLVVVAFEDYGKDVPKNFKMSPDAYIQMAMQLAYYRLHCKSPPTYESANLRMFLGGRTETIRSCSKEAKAFCEAMTDCHSTNREKADRLRQAIDAHREYTSAAMRGKGVDRHLLGLKLMAGQRPQKIPEFFSDHGYLYSRKFLISSSQVPAADNCVMSYGPSEDNGYGVCYNPLPKKIMFSVSSKNCSPETSSQKYANSLRESLTEMHAALAAESPVRSKL